MTRIQALVKKIKLQGEIDNYLHEAKRERVEPVFRDFYRDKADFLQKKIEGLMSNEGSQP